MCPRATGRREQGHWCSCHCPPALWLDHQPWQHRINPPVLALPGPGSPQLTRATEKRPGDIPGPGWGQAQSQHWVRKGCHHARATPAFIRVPPHAGRGLTLKMQSFGVTAQPGQPRALPHTHPQMLSHCTLCSGTGTPLAAAPALSSALKTIKYNQTQAGLGGRLPPASPGVHPALLPPKLPVTCTIQSHPRQRQG